MKASISASSFPVQGLMGIYFPLSRLTSTSASGKSPPAQVRPRVSDTGSARPNRRPSAGPTTRAGIGPREHPGRGRPACLRHSWVSGSRLARRLGRAVERPCDDAPRHQIIVSVTYKSMGGVGVTTMVDVGDAELACTEFGAGSPVLWLHGSGPGAAGMSNFGASLSTFGDYRN